MKPTKFFRQFSRKDISKELKILGLAFFVYYLAWGAIHPFFSIYFHKITGTYSMTGFLIGFMFLLQMLIVVPLGDLLDKIGRKKTGIISFFNYIGVGLVYFFSNSFLGLFVGRVWNAFSASGVWISGKTLARDYSKQGKEAESMGFFNFTWTLSMVFGPLIAILVLYWFPLRTVFLLLPISATVAALIFSRGVPETKKYLEEIKVGMMELVSQDKVFLKETKDFLSEQENLKVAFFQFMINFNRGVVGMILALFIKELGAELWQIAIIYSIFYLPFLTRLEFGAIADRRGRKKMITVGAVLSSVLFFGLFLTQSIVVTFVLALILSVGSSMIAPSVQGLITRLGKGREGEMTGIYQSMNSLGFGAGPIVAGLIADLYSLGHAFLLCGLLTLSILPVLFKLDESK